MDKVILVYQERLEELKVYYAEHIDPYLEPEEYEHNLSQVYHYKQTMKHTLHRTMSSIDYSTSKVILEPQTIRAFCPMTFLRQVKLRISSSLFE